MSDDGHEGCAACRLSEMTGRPHEEFDPDAEIPAVEDQDMLVPDGGAESERTVYQFLGDHPKTRILYELVWADKDLSPVEIAERAGIHRTTVYDHIYDLEDTGIVVAARAAGGTTLFDVDRDHPIVRGIHEVILDGV